MKQALHQNIIGKYCHVHTIKLNPNGERCVEPLTAEGRKRNYEIRAVWLVDGDDIPTVAVVERQIGVFEGQIVRVHLDALTMNWGY